MFPCIIETGKSLTRQEISKHHFIFWEISYVSTCPNHVEFDTSLSHSLMPSIYNVCCLILLNFCLLVLFVQNKINNIRSPYSTTIIYITELEMCVYSDTDRLNIIIKLVYMKLSLSCPYKCFYYHFVIFQLKMIFFLIM